MIFYDIPSPKFTSTERIGFSVCFIVLLKLLTSNSSLKYFASEQDFFKASFSRLFSSTMLSFSLLYIALSPLKELEKSFYFSST